MKRCVLLGSGGFPIILRLYLETLKKWQDEVDVIYLAIDNWYSSEVRDYIVKLVKQYPKVKLIDVKEKNPNVGWPNSYNVAYRESGENVKGWNVGDDVPLLNIKNSPTTIGGDTGFLLGLELFDKGVPFKYIPRSETAYLVGERKPIDHLIEQMKNKKGIFANGWLHLQNTGNTIPLWFKSDLDAREWQKDIERARLAWMYTMLQVEDYKDIPEFKKLADNVFTGVMIRCGLDLEEIKTISNIFQILLYD